MHVDPPTWAQTTLQVCVVELVAMVPSAANGLLLCEGGIASWLRLGSN